MVIEMSVTVKLKKVLEKGKISPDLRRAVKATLTAYKKKDYALAYELSAVKSLIATKEEGSKLPKRHHFHEQSSINQKVLGRDVYSIMDEIHFKLAMAQNRIPSGMTVLESRGVGRSPRIREKGKPIRKHPVISLMEHERASIRRRISQGLKF